MKVHLWPILHGASILWHDDSILHHNVFFGLDTIQLVFEIWERARRCIRFRHREPGWSKLENFL